MEQDEIAIERANELSARIVVQAFSGGLTRLKVFAIYL